MRRLRCRRHGGVDAFSGKVPGGSAGGSAGENRTFALDLDLPVAKATPWLETLPGFRFMLDPANQEVLEPVARVFCLSATPPTILQRLISDRSLVDRPLLSVPNPQHRIIDLLAERAPLYARFEQVDTDDRSTDAVVDDIVSRIEG